MLRDRLFFPFRRHRDSETRDPVRVPVLKKRRAAGRVRP